MPKMFLMNFVNKIEELINRLIFRFIELILRLLKKNSPPKLLKFYKKSVFKWRRFKAQSKTFPKRSKVFLIELVKKIKSKYQSIEIKPKFIHLKEKITAPFIEEGNKGRNKFVVLAKGFLKLGESWLKGLSFGQASLLIALTCFSFFATFNILSSGKKIADFYNDAVRSPASLDYQYERPEYYKKDQRHVFFGSVKIPVYPGGVNDFTSVDIEFNATLSNRESKHILVKLEFQLRDYLILHLEPILATFTLQEEGKEILKRKIWSEVDNFLEEREINGRVVELKITYVLAN
jgi:hypothetical protein